MNPFLFAPDSDDEYEQEEFPDSDSETSVAETIVYHTDMWGFYPHGQDEAQEEEGNEEDEEDDDAETVVDEWEGSGNAHVELQWAKFEALYPTLAFVMEELAD